MTVPETLGWAIAHRGEDHPQNWYLDTCVYPIEPAIRAEHRRRDNPNLYVVRVVRDPDQTTQQD